MRRWKNREQDEWVFHNKRTGSRYNSRPKLMPSLCKRAGIPYYGFHPIRHFVSSYLKNTAKVETKVLQQLLGHKDERTTEIYLHSVVESEKAATDALVLPVFAPKNEKAHNGGPQSKEGGAAGGAQVVDFIGRGGRI
ncbi:MAG: tyrosine-type recombinase/integrase [Deltaproteobacteria bacterium]|nr:tyrosine-type recombinase/integrase [Deltaproteobacteria bacterium]